MSRPFGSKDSIPPGIETGIPIPVKSREIYPWRFMKVGDSLFFRNRDAWDINVLRYKAEKRHGFKFTLRKQPGGIRVWRTA